MGAFPAGITVPRPLKGANTSRRTHAPGIARRLAHGL